MANNIFPSNCDECEILQTCESYYCGPGCIYDECAEAPKEDVVKEPSHYKHGRFETIDEMLIVFGPQKTYDYCIIAAWKYRARAPFKGNHEQDMRKADEYLELAKQISDANPQVVLPIILIKESKEE